jgi:hypothetical protein
VQKEYIKEEIPVVYYIKAMIIYLKSINILKKKIVYPKVEKNYLNVSSNMLRFYNKNFTELKKVLNISNETVINETFFNNKNKFEEPQHDILPIPFNDIYNIHNPHTHLEEVIINKSKSKILF